SGLDRALYEACDAVTHLNRLAAVAGGECADADLIARLQPLVDRGLLATDGQRYLALAIPLEEYKPPPAMRARIRQLVTLGRPHDRSAKEQRWRKRRPERKRQRRRPQRSSRRARRSGRP